MLCDFENLTTVRIMYNFGVEKFRENVVSFYICFIFLIFIFS